METLIIAVVLGLAFGFALDRIGATEPDNLLKMLSLRDLRLAKTILLGIGVASALMFAGQLVGLVDVGHMSVKTTYLGVLIGGLIFGLGWAISGYCPGTGVAALGKLRAETGSFVLGGLVGAVLFAVTYPFWKAAGLLDGSKATVGTIEGSGAEGLLGVPGAAVGLVLAALLIGAAFALPRFPLRQRTPAK